MKKFIDAYSREIQFSHIISESGHSHIVTFPIKKLTTKVFERCLLDAWLLASSNSVFMFAECGYILRHVTDNVLRFWYPSTNSQIFSRASFINGKESIEKQVKRFNDEEPYLVEQFVNEAPRSGYLFVRFVSLRFVMYKIK